MARNIVLKGNLKAVAENLDLAIKDTTEEGNMILLTAIPAALLTDLVVQPLHQTVLEAMTEERNLANMDTIERRDTTLLRVTRASLQTDPAAALQIILCHLKGIIVTIDTVAIIIDTAPEATVNHVLMGQVHGSPSFHILKNWLMNTGGKANRSANI